MQPDREIEAMATIARAFSAFGDGEEEDREANSAMGGGAIWGSS